MINKDLKGGSVCHAMMLDNLLNHCQIVDDDHLIATLS